MRATKVKAGLAESNGRLLLGIWRDSLHVTCGLTACTPGSAPGPTLGNEYGKTLFFKLISKPLQAPWFLWQYCTHHIGHFSNADDSLLKTIFWKTVIMFCTHIYQKTSIDTIILGNVHITKPSYLNNLFKWPRLYHAHAVQELLLACCSTVITHCLLF